MSVLLSRFNDLAIPTLKYSRTGFTFVPFCYCIFFNFLLFTTFFKNYRSKYSFFEFFCLRVNFAIHHSSQVQRATFSTGFSFFIKVCEIHVSQAIFEKSIREKTLHSSKKSAGRLRYITKCYLKKLLRLLIYQYLINKDIP